MGTQDWSETGVRLKPQLHVKLSEYNTQAMLNNQDFGSRVIDLRRN